MDQLELLFSSIQKLNTALQIIATIDNMEQKTRLHAKRLLQSILRTQQSYEQILLDAIADDSPTKELLQNDFKKHIQDLETGMQVIGNCKDDETLKNKIGHLGKEAISFIEAVHLQFA